MPKIDWTRLDPGIRSHLMDRMRLRQISASDLQALQEWILHSPKVPEGPWFKDFGTFKLCGEGKNPSTFLTADQPAFGEEVE
jgi:hypothetical protein